MPRPHAARSSSIPTPAAPVDRLLLTVEEAAAALGVGRSLMFQLIGSGVVDTVRVGRLRRIRPEALRAYIESLAA
jgi:excisionase family DNA binding protein